jgi:hypothetical protein
MSSKQNGLRRGGTAEAQENTQQKIHSNSHDASARSSRKGKKRAARNVVPDFEFQVPRKGDKNKLKEVGPYLKDARGKPLPNCAQRLLLFVGISVNETGATWHAEPSLIGHCMFGSTSLKKARRVLKAAGLMDWTDFASAPLAAQNAAARPYIDGRTNFCAVNFKKIREAHAELEAARKAAREERKAARKAETTAANATVSEQTRVASATVSPQTTAASATTNYESINPEIKVTMKGAGAPRDDAQLESGHPSGDNHRVDLQELRTRYDDAIERLTVAESEGRHADISRWRAIADSRADDLLKIERPDAWRRLQEAKPQKSEVKWRASECTTKSK